MGRGGGGGGGACVASTRTLEGQLVSVAWPFLNIHRNGPCVISASAELYGTPNGLVSHSVTRQF